MEEKPFRIWADDGETPYFYEEGEEIPDAAVQYIRADVPAAEIARLRARVAELEAALAPFARRAEKIEGMPGPVPDDLLTNARIGDLRRARAALRGEEG